MADLSDRHGNGVADITVRQNIQLHWVRIGSLPDLFDQLHSIGLSTTGACGDVTRNITGCPLAGLDSREIADVSPIALAIDKELAGNPVFYNLPRKFKITVTACPDWCFYPEINDIALTATRRSSASSLSLGPTPVAQAFRPEAFPNHIPGPNPIGLSLGSLRGSELQLRHKTSAITGLQPRRTPIPPSIAGSSDNGAGAAPSPIPPSKSAPAPHPVRGEAFPNLHSQTKKGQAPSPAPLLHSSLRFLCELCVPALSFSALLSFVFPLCSLCFALCVLCVKSFPRAFSSSSFVVRRFPRRSRLT
ncbi:MAG: hypothetical protein ABSG77_17825 [Candidatus Acidiferrum sp.]